MNVGTIQPSDLKALLEAGPRPVLLDVRQPEEVAAASIAGAVCIPMNEVPARIGELDPKAPIVVFCHHGMRSQRVAMHLAQNGFTEVKNLVGGIDAWSVAADPTVPRYEQGPRGIRVFPAPGR